MKKLKSTSWSIACLLPACLLCLLLNSCLWNIPMTHIKISSISSHCHILKIPIYVVFLSKRSLRADLWDFFLRHYADQAHTWILAASILALSPVYKFRVVMRIIQGDINYSKRVLCNESFKGPGFTSLPVWVTLSLNTTAEAADIFISLSCPFNLSSQLGKRLL